VLGICCHAAPINEAGRATAAISISIPVAMEHRLAERYDEIVRAAAVKISREVAAVSTRERPRRRVAV
jgi:DNA-binding IclR family transcriptional regulator